LLRFFRLAGFGVMPIPAGPERLLQLVHVSDLADAVVKAALASGSAGLFHIAEARAYSWREIAGMVAAAVGARARPIRVPGSLMTAAAAVAEGASRIAGRSTMFNTEKVRELLAPGWLCETDTARRVFGFEAAIPLRRGLDETANWYRQNGWL
jgi:nucleoside-diphosphate-sugar epimerase